MPRALEREFRRGLQWEILELHYRSRHAFQQIFKQYETRVAAHVEAMGVAREQIKLNAAETRELFDTPQLQGLLRGLVVPLREASHAYFRESDIAEPYDSKVSRIYHELSILKEEHLSVRDWPRDGGAREFGRLFREVSEYYPQRLRRVRDLFTRATKRLEQLLPQFADNAVVLRSCYLFREELWPDQPQAGLVRVLDHMFPAEGATHGLLCIARSFFKAGFFAEAAESARIGVATAGRKAQARTTRAQQLREAISELDSLAARAEAERKVMEEQEA